MMLSDMKGEEPSTSVSPTHTHCSVSFTALSLSSLLWVRLHWAPLSLVKMEVSGKSRKIKSTQTPLMHIWSITGSHSRCYHGNWWGRARAPQFLSCVQLVHRPSVPSPRMYPLWPEGSLRWERCVDIFYLVWKIMFQGAASCPSVSIHSPLAAYLNQLLFVSQSWIDEWCSLREWERWGGMLYLQAPTTQSGVRTGTSRCSCLPVSVPTLHWFVCCSDRPNMVKQLPVSCSTTW